MRLDLTDAKVTVDFNLNMAVTQLRYCIQDAISICTPEEINQMSPETLAVCQNLGQAIDDLGAVTDRHLKEWEIK